MNFSTRILAVILAVASFTVAPNTASAHKLTIADDSGPNIAGPYLPSILNEISRDAT